SCFFSSRRRHTRSKRDWSSDVCSSDLVKPFARVYGLDEHEMANPIDHYRSIYELFTRQLLPGLRPIDTSAHTLVSPVDGTLSEEIGRASCRERWLLGDVGGIRRIMLER